MTRVANQRPDGLRPLTPTQRRPLRRCEATSLVTLALVPTNQLLPIYQRKWLVDNDRRDLSQEIEDAEAELFVLFGAWTFHGYIKGSYQMASGVAAIDESAWFSVVVEESQIACIESVLRAFKEKTTQGDDKTPASSATRRANPTDAQR